MELFKTEMEIGRMQLNLFPQFEKGTCVESRMYPRWNDSQYVRWSTYDGNEKMVLIDQPSYHKVYKLTMFPHETAMPCKIYAGVYNKDKERLSTFGDPYRVNYSLFNQPDKIEVDDIRLLWNGELRICPVIEFMYQSIPVWDQEFVVEHDSPITIQDCNGGHFVGLISVGGIQKGDKVELEYVSTKFEGEHSGYVVKENYTLSELPTYKDSSGMESFNEDTNKLFCKAYRLTPKTIPGSGNNLRWIQSYYRAKVIRADRILYSNTFEVFLQDDGILSVDPDPMILKF